MKNRILTLIIGILIGAIIASAGFVIYIKTSNMGKRHNFGGPPQMNQSQNSDQNRGTPPEAPKGEQPNNSDGNSTDAKNSEQT